MKRKISIDEKFGFVYFDIVLFIAVMLLLSGCSGTKDIEHVYHHDTVYRNSVVHDSTYVDRWHTEYQKGDTIFVTNEVTKWKYVTKTDTAYKTVVDVQEKVVEKVVEKKVRVWWPLWVALGLIGGVALVEFGLDWIAKREDRYDREDR